MNVEELLSASISSLDVTNNYSLCPPPTLLQELSLPTHVFNLCWKVSLFSTFVGSVAVFNFCGHIVVSIISMDCSVTMIKARYNWWADYISPQQHRRVSASIKQVICVGIDASPTDSPIAIITYKWVTTLLALRGTSSWSTEDDELY